MTTTSAPLLTAGDIARTTGIPDARVKKAIKALGIQPTAKKGVCGYYDQAAVARIKAAAK
jgi:hypothetical protein